MLVFKGMHFLTNTRIIRALIKAEFISSVGWTEWTHMLIIQTVSTIV